TDGYTASQTITLAPSASVFDPDNLSLTGAVVSIASGSFAGDGDVLAADTAGTSITASYDTTSQTLTLNGADTLAHYQQVLDSVTFSSAAADPGNAGSNPTRTITWVLNDGGGSFNLSTAQTTTISVHAGPGIFVPASAAYTEQQGTETTLAPAVTLNDTAATTILTSATVALTGGTFPGDADLVQVGGFPSGTTGANISFSYNAATETLTLTGSDTFAHYQSALQSIGFSSSSDNPTDYGSDPTRTVSWTVVDNQGSVGTATSTLNITGVNDPPTLASTATGAQFTEGAGGPVLANAVSVIDPDNLDLASATVSISTGTFVGDGDVLAVSTAGTSITASYNAATETLTLTGA